MSILSSLREVHVEISGRGTKTIPVPDGAVAWEAHLWSGGGSGGVAREPTNGRKASGGSAGSYGNIKRSLLAGVVSLTAVLGAPGAAVTLTTDTATNGNDASSSTITDGTVTLTCPGGKGGKANVNTASLAAADLASTPTVSDSGQINARIGGTSGANTSGDASKHVATGGGSAAGPWGDGKNAGSVIGAYTGATGGASPFYVSGDVLGDGRATGGAGQGGPSGDATSSNTAGGGAFGASEDDSTTPGAGASVDGNYIFGSGISGTLLHMARGQSAGAVQAATTVNAYCAGPGGGGSSPGATSSNNFFMSAGGHMGGGGGWIHTGSGASYGNNNGGPFAGAGGCVFTGGVNQTGRKGGLGSGGGGTVSSGGTVIGCEGGEPHICVTFYIRD